MNLTLTNSKLEAFVDDSDYSRLRQFNWRLNKTRNSFTVHRVENIAYKSVSIPLANQVMNKFDCMFDHINGNALDCTKINLRECDRAQNSANKRKADGKSSTCKGVSLHKKSGKWEAYIEKRYKRHLGYFDTEQEAAKAYNEAAMKLFGKFAKLNVIC